MWYLLGAGALEEEPTTGLPWVAVVVNKVAAAVGAAGATTAATGATEATVAVAGGQAFAAGVARGATKEGGRRNCAP